MQERPLVSVIIPTYNRAHLIGETLDSVLAQTYQNWECIIVDDGSSDNTDEVVGEYIQKDPRFKYYHRPDEHLPGGNGARNYGFKMSQGEYVNWFDSDDLMMSKKLQEQVDIFKSNPELDVVFSHCRLFRSYRSKSEKLKPIIIKRNDFIKKYVLRKTLAPTSTALWHKNILFNFQFNEHLKQFQEYEFYSKLLSLAPGIHIIDQYLTLYRMNHESITIGNDLKQSERAYSHITSKLNLIKVFDHDKDIQLGLTNHLLSGLNNSLNNLQFDKKISFSYLKSIGSIMELENLKKYRYKWFLLYILSRAILIIGKGSFYFRGLYKF